MISKVIEEALENMVRRIESLEIEINILKKAPSPAPHPQKYNLATPGQIWKIKNEGGTPKEGMTKIEATKEIDRLIKEKEFRKSLENIEEPEEVDTDESGLDEEGLM